MEDELKTKICNCCNIELNIDNFYKDDMTCRVCKNDKRRNRYNSCYIEKARRKLTTYKQTDKNKNRLCDLDEEFVLHTIISECVYCGETEHLGCDRIDNNKGHTKDNCVPCCKVCNTARSNNFTHKEMFDIGKTIRAIRENRAKALSTNTI